MINTLGGHTDSGGESRERVRERLLGVHFFTALYRRRVVLRMCDGLNFSSLFEWNLTGLFSLPLPPTAPIS